MRVPLRTPARAAFALLWLAGTAAACPTCRDALAGSEARWARGFGVSIAFLLGVLVLVLGAFAFALWRAARTPSGA